MPLEIEECPACGDTLTNKYDRLYGHAACGLRTAPRFRMRRRGTGYHSSLARFPNDPEAHVDSEMELSRLIDKRQRQGWTKGPSYADLASECEGKTKHMSDETFDDTFDRCVKKALDSGLKDPE